MSARKNREEHPDQPTAEPEVERSEPAAATADQPAETAQTEEDPQAVLQRQIAELQDHNLRLMAEVRNQRQRAERDKAEALRYAEADFARDLLVILDDLERTLESAQQSQDVAAIREGVRIVYEHFLKVLRSHHIEPIEALGRPFDPAWHEALMQQPSPEHPAGTVIQELARGYKMHERVLRPSRVVVSSGPPQEEPEAQPGEEN